MVLFKKYTPILHTLFSCRPLVDPRNGLSRHQLPLFNERGCAYRLNIGR